MTQFRRKPTRNEMADRLSRQAHLIERGTQRMKAALHLIDELQTQVATLKTEVESLKRCTAPTTPEVE